MELSDKNLKAVIISMLHKVRVNTSEMNEMIQILNREMENRKRNQLKITELKNTISEVKKITGWAHYQNVVDKGKGQQT